MDLTRLMKQAQKLQSEMTKVEKEVNEMTFTGSAGNGVEVVVSGALQVVEVKVDEALLEKDNHEMLQDLIMVATNEALKQATQTKEQLMKKATGGMSLPGIF